MSLTAKQEAFVQYYADAGSDTYNNATQSAIKAGYSRLYANNSIMNILVNTGVKNEIVRYKAEIAAKVEVNRDYLIQQANLILANSDNDRNKLTALSLLGDFVGAKREHAPNAEREQARLELMDDETKLLAYELALLLTRRHSVEAADVPVEGLTHETGPKHALLGEGGHRNEAVDDIIRT